MRDDIDNIQRPMSETDRTIWDAIALVYRAPGYSTAYMELTEQMITRRIRFAPEMRDRGQTSLNGVITLGPEALNGSLLGLAETLIHENYHRRQNPFLKTVSFWAGIATGTHPMRRYERPAYEAAVAFLRAYAERWPESAEDARREEAQVLFAFRRHYHGALTSES